MTRKKRLNLLLISAFSFILLLSSCGSGAEDNSTAEATNVIIDSVVTDEVLERMNDDFGKGRYGFLYVSSGTGAYETYAGVSYDVLLAGGIDEERGLVAVNVINSDERNTSCGRFTIQYDTPEDWGFFVDNVLGKTPTAITHYNLDEYPDMQVISGTVEDDTGTFEFMISTKAWGETWDDVAQSMPNNVPLNYESWYLPLINAGQEMPV